MRRLRQGLPRVSITLDDSNRHRPLTWLAAIGVVAAVIMAVFGLPPVDLHGPLHHAGIMDPLCGGTRSVRYAFRGEWALAWTYNPLGLLVAAGGVLVTLRAITGWLTGRWISAHVHGRRAVFVILLVATAALAVRQQLHASLLMGT
jgi:hypothetical protein